MTPSPSVGGSQIEQMLQERAELLAALKAIRVWAIVGKPSEDEAFTNDHALANWKEDFARMDAVLAKVEAH